LSPAPGDLYIQVMVAGNESPLPDVPVIEMETLARWFTDRRPLTVLDVRPAPERAEWHIPGSLHVDAYDALWARDPLALASLSLPMDRPVVTVCGAGRTSLLAAAALASRGHEVYSLARGMRAWSVAWNSATVASGAPSIQQVRRAGKGCLSYIAVSRGEALVIDPSLDAAVYQRLAEGLGARIVHVLETHVHADHLSRARSLASSTGAALHLPAQERTRFPCHRLRDGDRVRFGDCGVTALWTPGHTGESTCYLLEDQFLFTGDTLLGAGVGRPDLEGGPGEAAARARDLHRSLQRLLACPGTTTILPGHTAEVVGFDGRPLCMTIDDARTGNRLLSLGEAEFVPAIVGSIPPAPPRYAEIVRLNEQGITPPGDPADLEAGANRCAVA